ncbi:GntR family transcriptional regulator [Oricola sp.]|uniref:GntR family transcriptional regulator n=1 Tax=Oricola sp. TaxID=1979950 RepID=UPI003BAD56F9
MTKTRAVSRQSLPETIANDLRDRILSGEIREGETIRQENLAQEYAVSRMPVREALKRLDAEGLLHLSNHRGATVIRHSLEEIGEIFDLRILIEVDLFRRAIPLMTEMDFARCGNILSQMETSYDQDDVSQWGALNSRYHAALYAAAQRGLTNDLLERISLQSDRYIRMHLSVMQQREHAKAEHRQLLALARAGDVNKAADLLARHIGRTKSELLALVEEQRDAEN